MLEVYEFYLLIRMISRMFEEEGTKMAKKVNLTHPQYLALVIIYYHERLLVSEIARIGSWHVSTVMNLISRLQEKNLVIIEPVDKGKGNEVIITELGQNLAEKFFINSSQLSRRLFDAMGSEGFNNNLHNIYRILEEVQGSEAIHTIKNHMLKTRKFADLKTQTNRLSR